jgi:hypothetical protein
MNVLWELRSQGDVPAHCAYQHVLPATHVITVTVGNTARFRQEYSTQADAHEEAAYLHDYFLLDWDERACPRCERTGTLIVDSTWRAGFILQSLQCRVCRYSWTEEPPPRAA